jgi:hypothetical protein
MARRGSLTGVDERGMSTRMPQEPGRSHDLRVQGRMGNRQIQAQARRSRVGVCGSEETTQMRYRQAKETKRAGMGRGKSELSILLVKRGNVFQRTPWREGGVGQRNRRRERW